MSETKIEFNLNPVEEKPSRKYIKSSKYDPLLEAIINSPQKLVKVEVEGKDAEYIAVQLKKRIDAKNTQGLDVSVVNGVCYVEKEES